jgi:hypothetical protein
VVTAEGSNAARAGKTSSATLQALPERTLEAEAMHKVFIGLSALLLVAAGSARVVAQSPAAEIAALNDPDCNYVCVFAASVDEVVRTNHSQSHVEEPQADSERWASSRSAMPGIGSEVLSAMARPVHRR